MYDLTWLTTYFRWRSEILVRGRSYYNKGAIAEVSTFNENNGTVVHGRINGTKPYNATISFDKYGKYRDAYCSCPYNKGSEGQICKHIAALYLYLKENSVPESLKISAGKDFLEELFESIEAPINKKNVNINYIIEFVSNWSESSWHISFRIGLDKMYVIKNVKEFIECLIEGGRIEFGKSFTFNSKIHTLMDRDKEIFDYFKQLYSTEMSYKAKVYGGSNSIFSGKNIVLNEELFIKYCTYMKNRSVTYKSEEIVKENVNIENRSLPFSIFIKSQNEKIEATIKYDRECKFIGRKDRLVLSQDRIYILDNTKKANEFLNIFRKRNISSIEFINEEKTKLLSLLPQIILEENIHISEEISQNYIRADIKANLYIDKYKKGISLILEFLYNDSKINPFNNSQINPYIIRDYAIENQIIRLIEDSEFKIKDERVYLEDYDRLYIFFRDIVPVLSELCSIYYTDVVKNMYLGRIKNYRSHVANGFEGNLININLELEGIDSKEIKEIFWSIKEKKNYHRLKNGSIISLEDIDNEGYTKLANSIDLDEIKENVIRLTRFRALSLFETIRENEEYGIENSEEIYRVIDKIKNPSLQTIKVPGGLGDILRDYQIVGFKWLYTLAETGFSGILADDMGLGKTIQAITLITSSKGNEKNKTLVVTPSSLVYNWENEIKKFAPDLKTIVISGNKALRQDMIGEINKHDVVITSYPLIRRDIELYENIEFNFCFLDEAQHIKNPESLNAISVKRINGRHRFALTGTPIENSLMELWSIFDFLMPGYLLTKNKFSDKFEKQIVKGGEKEALTQLKRIISPFILRRKKKDVLHELPDKIETKLICELTEQQKKLYTAYIARAKEEITRKIEEDGFERSRIQILSMITRLRQICCHPSVFIENYSGGSGKLDLLEELLDELIDGEHRILLFSQFTSLLDIIRGRLEEKNIKYLYLDGSVPTYKRMNLVDSFNDGEGSIFLISLKAGGTGLNLTSADCVIHFDPWWNPAVEDQASDRAHRIGQKNIVEVFKLITKDTIEEKIYELQNKKKELINSVIQEGETFINKLSEDEIMELFKIQGSDMEENI